MLRKNPSERRLSFRAPSARLALEVLEDRIVLNGGATTLPLPSSTAVSVSSTSYASTDILVEYRTNQPKALLAGTTVGPQLSSVNNLYEINLSQGVTVAQALAAYGASPLVIAPSQTIP